MPQPRARARGTPLQAKLNLPWQLQLVVGPPMITCPENQPGREGAASLFGSASKPGAAAPLGCGCLHLQRLGTRQAGAAAPLGTQARAAAQRRCPTYSGPRRRHQTCSASGNRAPKAPRAASGGYPSKGGSALLAAEHGRQRSLPIRKEAPSPTPYALTLPGRPNGARVQLQGQL